MKQLLTLLNLSCKNACKHCAYGKYNPMEYGNIKKIVKTLSKQFKIHFYDMEVSSKSIEIFKLTRQFELDQPRWLNISNTFKPSKADIDYLNSLDICLVLSLHGATAETHAMIAKYSFVKTIEKIKALQDIFKHPIGINYVVHKKNIGDILTMTKLAEDLHLKFIEFINLGFGGNCITHLDKQFAMDKKAFNKAYETITNLETDVEIELDAQWGPNKYVKRCKIFNTPVKESFCNAGINHIALRLDNLKVYSCPTLSSVDELQIAEFRGNRFMMKREIDIRRNLEEPCKICNILDNCKGGCRSIAIGDNKMMTNDLDINVGFQNCLMSERDMT